MKVSICIPTYKQIYYLQKNLESILIQDYTDYEVIITDDTPNDDVKTYVESMHDRFEGKLQYYKNAVSLGSPENWNKAVSYAKGEYIKILHHDDYFTEPYSLRKFVEALDNNPQVDFVFCAIFMEFYGRGTDYVYIISKYKQEELNKNPTFLFFENCVGLPSVTIHRRSAHLPYNKKLKWVVDFEFYIRILNKNPNFIFIDMPLIAATYRVAHNVTNECENNKEVELFEYAYLLNKIKKNIPKEEKIQYYDFYIKLMEKYGIYSVRQMLFIKGSKFIPKEIYLHILNRQIMHKIKQFRRILF